ncbi:LamG domain-containing protein [Lysinibacillus capsici]|uniref:LamG domain-containing protein n=1 Tax=Lysinibacillus capsici TaxID=2115968 RepID=UPI002FDC99A2
MATTEQLMTQYGVAWFGFDEASGNVIDKLGLNNYIGTVTGETRVGGWNGEGYAMDFNGTTQYATFNNQVIPVGEKTIRFKMLNRQNKATSRVICTSSTTTVGNISILLNQNSLVLYTRHSTGSITYPFLDVDLNKWYDIMIVFYGSTAGSVLKFYVNDKEVLRSRLTANEQTGLNMRLGNIAGTLVSTDYFNGQIDDLQIYNKALSPSDFEQKRLVVKTTDNKNLVLSPNSARVKEIPSTVEYMMLAQGGVVREIDSAVDSQPIDFTKPTTEYELVTNNKTLLGKGRMFTIPIGTGFKTAMIEDNY